MKAKRGEWKKTAQVYAEKQARKFAHSVWDLYWRKLDRQKRKAKRV